MMLSVAYQQASTPDDAKQALDRTIAGSRV